MVINKNLHQSRAGIGNKLKTQRLIEIIAHNIITILIQCVSNTLVIKSTIQIGHFILSKACDLSFGVSGKIIFLNNIQIHLNVRTVCQYVSIIQYFIDSITQYLYLKLLSLSIHHSKYIHNCPPSNSK